MIFPINWIRAVVASNTSLSRPQMNRRNQDAKPYILDVKKRFRVIYNI